MLLVFQHEPGVRDSSWAPVAEPGDTGGVLLDAAQLRRLGSSAEQELLAGSLTGAGWQRQVFL